MIEDRKANDLVVLMPPLDLSRKRMKIQKVQQVNARYAKPAIVSRSAERGQSQSPILNASTIRQLNPETTPIQTNYKRVSHIHKTVNLVPRVPRPESSLTPIENKPQMPNLSLSKDFIDERLHFSRLLLESTIEVPEINIKSLKLGDTLQETEECVVKKAYWWEKGKLLVVKTKYRNSDIQVGIMRQLNHKNIVTLYGVERLEGQLNIFMEFMSGGSLSDTLKEFGPLDQKVIKKYTRTLLDVICYLNRLNVVHRDIRCSNILSDCKGNIKLAGFGCSRVISSGETGSLDADQTESFVGSFYWMAPELVYPRQRANKKVDIWGLGCTVIEMATGKHPWHECKSFMEFAKLMEEERMPPIPSHLSSECQEFLRGCFTFEVRERKSAQELRQQKFVCVF